MTTRRILFTVLLLSTACGPAAGDDSDSETASESASATDSATGSESASESDSVTDSDTATATGVAQCYYEDQVLDPGAEVQTPDGCISYVCAATGALDIVEDLRFDVDGDLTLATQAEVDAQTCLRLVDGALTITGSAADLTPLSQLTRVAEKLEIRGTAATTLEGLSTLVEVGDAIVIADNQSLTTMSFLPYMSVFGDVTIQNNDVLPSLAGAGFLGECGNCAVHLKQLGDGEATTGGSDQDPGGDGGAPADAGDEGPTGGSFYGNILIADNDALTDLSAMGALFFAWADVRLRNNASLTSLAALQLSEVRGSLEITDNAALSATDAQAFADTIDVWGSRIVCGNLDGVACE